MKTVTHKTKITELYLKGCLTIRADGPFNERFINICMHRGLTINSLKLMGRQRIVFKTDINSYKQMRDPAKRTKSRLKIIKKQGLPFVLYGFRHRKAALAGVLAAIILLAYTSTHVMGITVYGNLKISKEEILSQLADCGVSVGTKTSDISPDYVRNTVINSMDNLAWIGINANGSHLYIEVVERLEKENGIVKDDVPCNIVAAKDGIITGSEIRMGQLLVKPGYGVIKGDVLVSGIVNTGDGYDFVHSLGEVYAETIYAKTKCYPLKYTENIPTENSKSKYSISILNHTLPLYFKSQSPYPNYTEEKSITELKSPFDRLPSIFISSTKYTEVTEKEKVRTEAETAAFGAEELTKELSLELSPSAEIKDINETHTLTEHGQVQVTVEIKCIENIAEEAVIEGPAE